MQRVPDFINRDSISIQELRRVCDPVAIFEGEWRDSDGVQCFAYSVAGFLDGRVLGGAFTGGVLVGDQAIVVHAADRDEADFTAVYGLITTIHAEHKEFDRQAAARKALARMKTVSPLERIEQAIKPGSDKSDAFVEDALAIEALVGDGFGGATETVRH